MSLGIGSDRRNGGTPVHFSSFAGFEPESR